MKARTAQDIWEAALGELQIQVNKANYQTWLKDTHGVSYLNDQFVVGVPTEFVAEWLAKRYIRAAFPTAFDLRWRAKLKDWQKLLKKHSEWLAKRSRSPVVERPIGVPHSGQRPSSRRPRRL